MRNFFMVLILVGLSLSGGRETQAQFSTPYELQEAVEEGDFSEVRNLMAKCRCPNTRNGDGTPILVLAATQGNRDIAGYLMENGANPNATGRENGLSALMAFAERGNRAGIELMLNNGANIDAGDATGETALIKAVRARANSIVQLLLEQGADIMMPDYQGRTALDHARNLRNRRLVGILEQAR